MEITTVKLEQIWQPKLEQYNDLFLQISFSYESIICGMFQGVRQEFKRHN